jgi:lysophospholipase L1-like esterase
MKRRFVGLKIFAVGMLAMGGCASDDGAASGSGSSGEETETADGTSGSPTSNSGTGTSAGSASVDSSGGPADTGDTGTVDDTGDTGNQGGSCLDMMYVNGPAPGPEYDNLTIGSHCQGTNHQDIAGIERVVFLGDSVTVGTRPTGGADFYRSRVADALVDAFGLMPPDPLWKQANPISGQAAVKESGSFASCAEWGARNDDLMTQLEDCFSDPTSFDKVTLIVLTSGGNDLASIIKDAIDGAPSDELLAATQSMLDFHEDAMHWVVDEPAKFPNGVFVVAANPYEFTDVTGDVLSCPAAGVAGFNMNPPDKVALQGGYDLILEEYGRIASETGTDLVFMSEGFCGHGFHADDPENVCYRGPGSAVWFDLTCIHPTPDGHAALAEMFVDVISE